MSLNTDIHEVKELEKHLFSDYLREWVKHSAEFTLNDPLSVSVKDLLNKIKDYVEGT